MVSKVMQAHSHVQNSTKLQPTYIKLPHRQINLQTRCQVQNHGLCIESDTREKGKSGRQP